jgi:hypothetical protein
MITDNKRRDVRHGKTVKAKDIQSEILRDGPSAPEYRWFL